MNENKTNINWYPGHMAKTKRELKKVGSLIDIVYEVIDSRMPISSRVEEMDEIIKDKPRIIISTKYDLCDKKYTDEILDKYKEGNVVIPIDLLDGKIDKETAWKLLNKIANRGVIYFAFNGMISVCENTHGFFGDVCPKCGKHKVDTFQRIVGYLVPSSNYSKERYKEFKGRYWYDLNDSVV